MESTADFAVTWFAETWLIAELGDIFIITVEADAEGGVGVSGRAVEGGDGAAFSANGAEDAL